MTMIVTSPMKLVKVRYSSYFTLKLQTHRYKDIPSRSQTKKHDEESVTSGKRDESPILKKAPVTLQLRSKFDPATFDI